MCLQCALSIDFIALVDDDQAHSVQVVKPAMQMPKKVDLKSLSETKDGFTLLESQCKTNCNQIHTHRSAADSDSTNSTKLSQRFICAFHEKEIQFKHTSKNKFYCEDCNVKPE